jgi:hypothetical protein
MVLAPNTPMDTTPNLNDAESLRLQEIMEVLFYMQEPSTALCLSHWDPLLAPKPHRPLLKL